MRNVTLATEDPVSEAVGRRLLADHTSDLVIVESLGGTGFGYLRSRVRNFCEIARTRPVVLITDLDRIACPPALITDWLGTNRRPSAFLLRIAVREIESWLLADRTEVADFLSVPARHISSDPESIPDPKGALLGACRRAPRDVRMDMVAGTGSLAAQGLLYNQRLCQFVQERWSPARASRVSRSLDRARFRLSELAAGVAS